MSLALTRLRGPAKALAPGVAVSFALAAVATLLAGTYGGPVMLFALLLGMALAFLGKNPI